MVVSLVSKDLTLIKNNCFGLPPLPTLNNELQLLGKDQNADLQRQPWLPLPLCQHSGFLSLVCSVHPVNRQIHLETQKTL